MARRSRRLVLLFVGLLITAGLGYRAQQDERALSALRAHAVAEDRAADAGLLAIGDLRSALYAYVSAGQEIGPWAQRASAGVDALREHLLALDAAVARSGSSMADALDGLDQFEAAEKRARNYADVRPVAARR